MNIKELFNKYKHNYLLDGHRQTTPLMDFNNFKIAIAEIISSPVEPLVRQKPACIEFLINYCKGLPEDIESQDQPTLKDICKQAEMELKLILNKDKVYDGIIGIIAMLRKKHIDIFNDLAEKAKTDNYFKGYCMGNFKAEESLREVENFILAKE